MKIALTTIGSRGDIQPYIALGIELHRHGHSVSILTHPWANELVNSFGLTHIQAGDDIDINYWARQFVGNSASNLKGFRFSLNFIFDRLRNCHKDFLAMLENFDLVIGHGIVGETEAEMLRKPFITVSIAPMGLQKEYWKSRNLLREFGVYLSDKLMGAVFGRPYMRFRKDTGAPPRGNSDLFPYLALIPMPLFLQQPNPNWKETTRITGYFFADTPVDYSPDHDITKFINNGEKPVLVTFGSMFHHVEQANNLYQAVCDATERSGSRAILIMPDLDETVVKLPENIFLAGSIPYSWLLDRVSLVVHHFGFGTTAEVLRAGLPSIPVPHIFDQKIRASAIHKLGYAHRPLDINKITGQQLSEAIVRVRENQEMKVKCLSAEKLIARENGTENAAQMINRYIENLNITFHTEIKTPH
jgi:sterol 3beta-glucosyltransferase